MKYQFNCNYCMLPKSINLIMIEQDFSNNLCSLLFDLGVKPKATAYAVAKSAYWRMTGNNMKFHSPTHIMAGIQMYQNMILDGLMRPLSAVQELALWFHDIAHYKGGVTRYSRDLAVAMLEPWMNNTFELGQLIDCMSSNFYKSDDIVNESAILLDIDLHFLGAEEGVFNKALDLLREEDPDESDDEYKLKLYDWLDTFRKRGTIFRTKSMAPYEKLARKNIEQAIELLSYT